MPWVMQIWSWAIPLVQPMVICLLAWSVYRQRTARQSKWFVAYCFCNASQAIFGLLGEWIDPDLPYYIGQGLEPISTGMALAAIYEIFQQTIVGKKRDRDWFVRLNAGYLVVASLLALRVHDFNAWKLLRVVHILTMAARMVEIALLLHLLVLIGVFGYYLRRLPLAIVLGLGADAAASLAGTYILTVYGYSHFSSMVLLQLISFTFAYTLWLVAVWTQPAEVTRLAAATPGAAVDWAPALQEFQKIDPEARKSERANKPGPE